MSTLDPSMPSQTLLCGRRKVNEGWRKSPGDCAAGVAWLILLGRPFLTLSSRDMRHSAFYTESWRADGNFHHL